MSVPYVTTRTRTIRPDLDVEVNDGESSPALYLSGVQHSISTIEQYVDAINDAIRELHEWYPGWSGWSGDGDKTTRSWTLLAKGDEDAGWRS